MAYENAVKALISRRYLEEGWVDFIPFNHRYQRRLLNDRTFLTILPSCCNKAGQISKKNRYMEKYYCPHCGRFSDAEILGSGPFDESLIAQRHTEK